MTMLGLLEVIPDQCNSEECENRPTGRLERLGRFVGYFCQECGLEKIKEERTAHLEGIPCETESCSSQAMVQLRTKGWNVAVRYCRNCGEKRLLQLKEVDGSRPPTQWME